MTGSRAPGGGRKRKPAVIRKLEGHRGHRPIPNEPAAYGVPKMPDDLGAAEREIWRHIVATIPKGVMGACDALLLETCTIQAATFREAQRQIRQTGLTVETAEGHVAQNPLLRIRDRAHALLMRGLSELAMTPVSRTKIVAKIQEETDPLALLLGDDPATDPWSTAPRPRN